jgi:hypothetical protein
MTPDEPQCFFPLKSSTFYGPRRFVVPANEIFDTFCGFWATVAPSYVICENPVTENFYSSIVLNRH